MKRLALFATIFLAAAVSCKAQRQTDAPAGIPLPSLPSPAGSGTSAEVGPEARVFRVRVVDGRSGSAISGVRLQFWYDEPTGMGYAVATGGSGIAMMPKPVGDPLRVLVGISGYKDCRDASRASPPEGYNLALIAEKGVVAQNACGGGAVRSNPGALVLYVRSSRWYENLNKSAP